MGCMSAPPPAEHDTTDWTFVVDEGCAECGYRPHDPHTTSARLTALVPRWTAVLQRPDATRRPEPAVWSPVEYASHSRDLVRVLGERVALMTSREDPPFADYDGEAEAVRQEFWSADPQEVASQIAARTAETAAVIDEVGDWERTGQRGGGRRFTVTQLCRYLLHDVEHHLHDVAG